MPGLDGTGPMGSGPMTGGRRGICNPQAAAVRAASIPMGFGRGGGRGHRRMYHATGLPGWMRFGGHSAAPPVAPATQDKLTALQAQADVLRRQLDAMTARITELDQK